MTGQKMVDTEGANPCLIFGLGVLVALSFRSDTPVDGDICADHAACIP